MRRSRAARILVFALLALALGAGGCQRRTRYQPLTADSTGVTTSDSLAVLVRNAMQSWDAGSGEDAARLSAGVVLADLRGRLLPEWATRARALLDSLGIGAEVGEAPDAIVVNFFSRSDPENRSWPWLFWGGPDKPRMQGLEGRDLRFMDLATRPGSASGPSLVFAVFGRRAAAGAQPIAFVWKSSASGAFSLVQTLGSDSLGGSGTAEFVTADTTLELRARTFRTARSFSECATCPHVFVERVFAWGHSGFVGESAVETPSPYSTFVRFIHALQANDRSAGLGEITDASLWDEARQLDWHQPKGLWRVAPATDETAHEMIFMRGEREAYRVSFDSRLGSWKIAGFESTAPNLE